MARINGTDEDDVLNGTKGNDYIIAGFGDDEISAGKGADTLYFGKVDEEYVGNNGEKRVYFHKGDGNDAIIFKTEEIYEHDEELDKDILIGYKPVEADLPSKIDIKIEDAGAEISYGKAGENLLIIVKYTEGKKTITDTMKINYYFEDIVEDDTVVDSKVRDAFKDMLYINGAKLTVGDIEPLSIGSGFSYGYNATVYNGSAYDDKVIGTNKNDIIVLYTGDDEVQAGKKGYTYIESTGGNDTYYINNFATLTQIEDKGGNDLIQFNGANKNDLHLFFDITKDGVLVDDRTDTDGNEYAEGQMVLTSLSGLNSLKNPSKLKGAVFSRYLQEDCAIEHIQIADKKGENIEGINSSDIEYLKNKLEAEIKPIMAENYNYQHKDSEGNDNDIYYSAADVLASYNKADAANKAKILNIYKKYSLGTNGDNKYKINKAGAVIASGAGNDTLTFTGKFGDSSVLASDYNGDSITIKNYAFSKKNLEINKSDNNVNLIGSEVVKGNKIEHNLELVDFAATNGNTVSLKDKSYQYELSYNKTNWLDYNINRVAIIDKNGTNTLTYKNNTVTNKGNHDIYMSLGNCNDTYRIENFDKTTDLAIFDSGNNNVTGDKIIFTNSELNGDIRLFANFDSEGNVLADTDTYLIHREGINKKNISKNGVKNGIRIVGDIETVTAKNGNVNANADVDSWINALGETAASWLGEHSKYSTTAEVFSKGSSADINSLLAVYLDNTYTQLTM